MIRPALVVALAVVLAGCGGSDQTVAEEWLPKLQIENARTCQQDDCSTEVTARRIALTDELAADAREAGAPYAAVAVMAARVNLAHRHWQTDCYPAGAYSSGAGMSCDEALTLSITGTDELEDLLRSVAVEERRL